MRHILAPVILFTALAAAPLPTSADESTAESAGVGRMMLVLDASGSMAEATAGGGTKISAAKSALLTVVDSLPEDQPVGLRVYGSTVFSAAEPGACTDSQRVVDIGTTNRKDLRAAVADYEPYGETPIGYALQEAGKDLGGEGQRSIVLVSDGEPTCDPDPCVVAAELSQQGIDLRIDVVGLNVSGAAREKLRCIAEAGNGDYVDADDAQSLTESLTVAQTRASRPFDLTGEAVRGTSDAADAPTIEAPGQYLDSIATSGELHYRVPRTVTGSTIHVGVAFQGSSGSTGESVRVSLLPGSAPTGGSCGSETAYGVGVGAAAPLFYGGAQSWKSDPENACNTDDEIVVRLDPGVGRDALAGKPIEIAVYEEPPLEDASASGLLPAAEEPTWQPITPGAAPADGVVAGTSIANAPVVADGSYALDINAGETQVFAVPLGWGQSIQAQVDATLTPATADSAAVGSDVSVKLIGPLRQDGEVDSYGSAPPDWTTGALGNMSAGDAFRTGVQSFPVTYLNRSANSPDVRAFSTPGLRYVAVSLETRGDTANQPYTLTLVTSGRDGEGEPAYASGGPRPPEADSRLVTAGAAPPAETSRGDAADRDDDEGAPWPWLGLGGLGVLVVATVAALVVRSRRTDGDA